jgi:hypothetical protein
MVELGKIEKPEAESFKDKRKLYCVPHIFTHSDAPDEFQELAKKFWESADEHIANLEKAGAVNRIFCDGIMGEGDKAIEALEKLNALAHGVVKKRFEQGASIFSIEDENIYGPFSDWRNCLHVVRTKTVFSKILESYNELLAKRQERIMEIINTNLKAGEAGLLIMADEERARLQFPNDIEVFLVTPPTYDDILRWIRDSMKQE